MYTMSMEAPDRLYKAIRLAVEDLRKIRKAIEEDKAPYVLDLEFWHGPEDRYEPASQDNPCAICFAGTIMATQVPADNCARPYAFSNEWHPVFEALDKCAVYNWDEAVNVFNDWNPLKPEVEQLIHSETLPKSNGNQFPSLEFDKEMLKAAEIFEEFDI